jgi:acetoin utilization deacetylase AcuC-like enzyme
MSGGPTAYIFDEHFLEHDTGIEQPELPLGGTLESVEHPSSVRITRRTHALIAGSGLLDRLLQMKAETAQYEDLYAYHTPEYVEHIRAVCASGGGPANTDPAENAPVSAGSFEAARLAVGAGMRAVESVLSGEARNAYALLRPPGHHAMSGEAMGFCIFNNIVLAARHAQRAHGLRRIMILDWDVHHGNGTQAAFYDDPDVLFLSLHQDNWYPAGWGLVEQCGGESAKGTTVNVPLPAGTGDHAYLSAIERVARPIASQFRPELILVSAGQDPSFMDPHGRMQVTMDGFRGLATAVQGLADELCGGRLAVLQEGGYSAAYVPFCTLGVVEGLLGDRSAVPDPYGRTPELHRARAESAPWQSAAIDRAMDAQREFWNL